MVATTKHSADGFKAFLGVLLDQKHTDLAGKYYVPAAGSRCQVLDIKVIVFRNRSLNHIGRYLFIDFSNKVLEYVLGQLEVDLLPVAKYAFVQYQIVQYTLNWPVLWWIIVLSSTSDPPAD